MYTGISHVISEIVILDVYVCTILQSVETMEDWVAGKIISRILVGGEMSKISGTEVVTSGLQGCVEVGGLHSLPPPPPPGILSAV